MHAFDTALIPKPLDLHSVKLGKSREEDRAVRHLHFVDPPPLEAFFSLTRSLYADLALLTVSVMDRVEEAYFLLILFLPLLIELPVDVLEVVTISPDFDADLLL